MANPPGDKKNIVKLAYLYFQEGRWDNAIEEYKKLLELDPEDINVHNMLGDVYVKKSAWALAYDSYNRVANDLISRGQIDKATVINRKIARLDSNQLSPEARQKQNLIQLHMKADEAMEEGRVEEAMEAFTAIIKLDPDDLIVAAKLAELEEKSGRVSDAVREYMVLGENFMKGHLFKKAQEMFKKVVTMDPGNKEAHLYLAQIYMKQGSENDAKKEYLSVAEQALAADETDKALEYAQKAVELKSIEAHYIVGVVYCKQAKWNEAKAELDNLLRFKVNHVGALAYLGKCFAGMGQNDKAAETFQKAIKLEKDNVQVMEAWAEFSVNRKNKADAVPALNFLIDKMTADKQMDKAIDWARQLVSVDDKLATSRAKLGDVLKVKGDMVAAADAYCYGANLLVEQNKPDEAAEYAKKALEADPSNAKARAMSPEGMAATAAASAAAAAAQEEAERAAQAELAESRAQVVDVSPQEAFKAQLAVADQYVKQSLLDEAIDIYQQLLDVDPENAEVKKRLNSVYTAYAKTGTDLTSVFAAPPVEAAKPAEAPKPATPVATTPAPAAPTAPPPVAPAPAAAAAEAKAVADEAAKKNLKELEAKAREEADKKVRAELEKRAREEADKKAEEEIKRLAAEKEKKAQAAAKPEAVLPKAGGMDDMVKVAEADLLRSQGKNEEALKIYHTVLASNPTNEDVKKKLATLEEQMKPKAAPAPTAEAPKAPPALKVVEKPAPAAPAAPADKSENDTNLKKKSNKIGYV